MTIKDEIKFLEKKKDLVEKLNLDKGNCSKQEYQYLKALLNLEVSVLNDDHYMESLEEKDYFISLALYNICKRNINLLSDYEEFSKNIEYFFDESCFYAKIKGDHNKLFYIELNKLYSVFFLESKMYQGYLCSSATEEELIGSLESRKELINSGKLKNSDGSFKSYRERQFELLNINKELQFIEKNKKEIIDIYNLTNETLRKDYGVRKNDKLENGLVRSLSFVDIYEKRI